MGALIGKLKTGPRRAGRSKVPIGNFGYFAQAVQLIKAA
jgi:hypothetical protein